MSEKLEGEYIPAGKGPEALAERDEALSGLAQQLHAVAQDFVPDAMCAITGADAEVGKGAVINTEHLSKLKAGAQKLQALIAEVESVSGIIEGDTPLS